MVGAAVCDALIAIFMSWIVGAISQKWTKLMLSQLWSNQTGIKRTDDILTRLIRLTIETGSTALISLFPQDH
jgi:hypothetical protein